MTYSVSKTFRIHHDDGLFYQFRDEGDGCVEVSYYEIINGAETKKGTSLYIPQDCIELFINTLEKMK